ncbi:MAG: colanic acid exporter [Sulfurovum sp.]|nr:MAG: colanic acid exporter [Sulfurovum sp.]
MALKNKVLHGVKWVTFANIFGQVLSLISIVIFAKLLSPDDFGTFAIIMIFIGFLGIFSDMGTTAALIHIQNPSKLLLSSVFYLNIFIGIVLTLAMILLSAPIATFFEDPQITDMLQIVSLNFIIVSFGVVQKALLQKSIEFKHLSLVQSVAMFIGIIVGISSAIYGLGVYSLIAQTLVSSIIGTAMIWFYTSWRPEWSFSFTEIKKIWKYTANLSVFEFINYFAQNADNFLIGKYLSSGALGVYSLAYKIMLYPLQNISRILVRVLFPAFSKLQNDNKKFRQVYLRVIFYISLVSFPIMSGLIVIADVLVDVLFGDKWQGLAMLLIILAPSGIMRSVFTTVGTIFMAKGSTDTQLKLGTINAILTVVGFIIGLNWGVNGVAFSYLIVNIIMLYPIFKISWGQIELSVKDGLAEMRPVFIISILMGLGVYFSDIFIFNTLESQLLRLILMISVGLLLYLIMLRLHFGNLKSLISELKK